MGTPDRCPDCGASYALVGRRHRCLGVRPAPVVVINSAADVAHAEPIPVVAHGVAHSAAAPVAHVDKSRWARWRAKHPDKHAANQRAYRARRKARAKG